jgi:hypothetical protein
LLAEVHVKQVDGIEPHRVHFEDARQQRQHLVDRAQIGDAEAARALGRERKRVDLPAREHERHHDVVGCALRNQVVQDREVELWFRHVEPAPESARAVVDRLDRAVEEALVEQHLARDRLLLDALAVVFPDEARADELRVQRADRQPHAQERDPRIGKSLRELLDEVARRRCGGCLAHQPAEKRVRGLG